MEDSWMEDSRHAFLLQVRETFVGLKESSKSNQSIEYPRKLHCFSLGFDLLFDLNGV